MKTTIELSDALLDEARTVAAREGITLRALLEEGLRRGLQERRRRSSTFRLRDASVDGEGLRPELRGEGWDAIADLVYGDERRKP